MAIVHSTNSHPSDEIKKPNIWIRRFLISEITELNQVVSTYLGRSTKHTKHLLSGKQDDELFLVLGQDGSVSLPCAISVDEGSVQLCEMFTVNFMQCVTHLRQYNLQLPLQVLISFASTATYLICT